MKEILTYLALTNIVVVTTFLSIYIVVGLWSSIQKGCKNAYYWRQVKKLRKEKKDK